MRATAPLCLRAAETWALLLVGVLDLVLGDFFQGHGQVVLRARLDERRRSFLEAHALTELVVIVVDLPGALCGDDDERVARVDSTGLNVQQFIDTRMDHERGMVAASASSRSIRAWSASVARATSSL